MNYASFDPYHLAPTPPQPPVSLESTLSPGVVNMLTEDSNEHNEEGKGINMTKTDQTASGKPENATSPSQKSSNSISTEVEIPSGRKLCRLLEESSNVYDATGGNRQEGLDKYSQSQQISHLEDVLCGYLKKLSSQQKLASNFFIKPGKSLGRQRWMVFSERSCKLFYYKSKGDTDALGEINITGATFNYDPEDPDGLFSIISDGQTHTLAAGDDKSRQRWLDGLQEAKLSYINTSKEVVHAPPRIQWYTDLPSTGTPLPSPSTNFVDILQNTTNRLGNTFKSSAKNSFFSKANFSSTSMGPSGSFSDSVPRKLPSSHSSPVTDKNDQTWSGQRICSQEEVYLKSSPVPLKPVRPAPQPSRPTTLHITDPTDRINNNSEGPEHDDLVDALTHDVPKKISTSTACSKSPEGSPIAHNNLFHRSMEKSRNVSLDDVSPFQRTRTFSKSFTSGHANPAKYRHSCGLPADRSSSDVILRNHLAPSVTSKDLRSQQKLRYKSGSPGTESLAGLRQIGADLKASITRYSGGHTKRSLSGSVSEDQFPECAGCRQAQHLLQQCEERLESRTEELAAAKQGITLLQQDLALLHRQRQTQTSLEQPALTDEHLLEILREKDRSLVTFEQSDCLQKNEIAELQQQQQQLKEQLDLLATLLRAKDNAIRSISDELEEFKDRYALNSSGLQHSKSQRSNSLTQDTDQPLVRRQSSCMMPGHQCLSSTHEHSCLSVEAQQGPVDTSKERQSSGDPVTFASNSQVMDGDTNATNSCQKVAEMKLLPASSACDAAMIPLPTADCVLAPEFDMKQPSGPTVLSETAIQGIPVCCSNFPNSSPDINLIAHSSSSFASSDASLSSPSLYSCYSREQSIPDSVFGDNFPMIDIKRSAVSNHTIGRSELESLKPTEGMNKSSLENSPGVHNQNLSSLSDCSSPAVSASSSCNKTISSPRFFSSLLSTDQSLTNSGLDLVYFHRKMSNPEGQRSSVEAVVVLPGGEASLANTGSDNETTLSWGAQLHRHRLLTAVLEETTRERDHFKESYMAYKNQNAFLHKQIIELSQASDMMKQREERLKYECSVWEAQFQRVRSKYLVLLNDLHSPPCQQHDRETLARMLSDALTCTPDLRAVCSSGKSYDDCGFCISASDEDSLQRCAVFLSRQAQTTVRDQHEEDKQTESAWESIFAGTTTVRDTSLPFPDLRPLIRERGIPLHYRPKIWRLLVDRHVGSVRRQLPETYYEDLLARCIIRPTRDGSSSEVDEKTKKQIELDLLRTLPNNRYYENEYADNIIRLRRVLLAFAVHNREISYCQGLNRLAAIALLFLPEAEAFWCLVCVVEHLMPEQYFTPRLLGPQIDQRVLRVLIADKLPQLHFHLNRHRLDISMITFNWFLCLFVEELPHAIYLHIWDSFLLEGSKVMFRYALAILKLCEEGIMARTEFMDVSNYLRSVPPPLADIARLRQAAFHWANPLRRRQLKKLRALHNEEVLVEVAEQEVLRQQYKLKVASAAARPTAAQLLQLDEKEEGKQAERDEEQRDAEARTACVGEGLEDELNKLQKDEQCLQQRAQDEQKEEEQGKVQVEDKNLTERPHSVSLESCPGGAPRPNNKRVLQQKEDHKMDERLAVQELMEKLAREITERLVPLRPNEPLPVATDSTVEGGSTPASNLYQSCCNKLFVPVGPSEPPQEVPDSASGEGLTPAKFWVPLPVVEPSPPHTQPVNTSQQEAVERDDPRSVIRDEPGPVA